MAPRWLLHESSGTSHPVGAEGASTDETMDFGLSEEAGERDAAGNRLDDSTESGYEEVSVYESVESSSPQS